MKKETITQRMSNQFESLLRKCGPYSYGLGITANGYACISSFSSVQHTILGKRNVEQFLNVSCDVETKEEIEKLFVDMAMKKSLTEAEEKAIFEIAKQHIYGLENREDLEQKYSDSLDFIDDVSVWCLKAALIAAYNLGKAQRG